LKILNNQQVKILTWIKYQICGGINYSFYTKNASPKLKSNVDKSLKFFCLTTYIFKMPHFFTTSAIYFSRFWV